MADVVNLRQFRKRKQRADREAEADENRKLHGISKKLKQQSKTVSDLTARKLDGKILRDDD